MTTTETPKTAKTETPFTAIPSLDPTQMWAQGQQAWTKLVTESLQRWQSFADQFAAVEAQVATQAQTAVTHWADLARDAIAYGTQLSSEARKLSVDTAKKMGLKV